MSDNLMKYPPHVNAVVQIVDGYSYGDVVPKEKLNEWFGLSDPVSAADERQYAITRMRFTARLKEDLLMSDGCEANSSPMYLKSNRKGGYKILHPREQSVEVVRKYKEAIKKALKNAEIGLVCINHNLLNADEKKENERARIFVASNKQAIDNSNKSVGFTAGMLA